MEGWIEKACQILFLKLLCKRLEAIWKSLSTFIKYLFAFMKKSKKVFGKQIRFTHIAFWLMFICTLTFLGIGLEKMSNQYIGEYFLNLENLRLTAVAHIPFIDLLLLIFFFYVHFYK